MTRYLAAGALLAVAACASPAHDTLVVPTLVPQPGSEVTVPPVPDLDPDLVAIGADLYAANCAECHGSDLRGDPNWMRPADDGGFRPPPHDSSGHTWHHADDLLIRIVLTGYGFEEPQSRMPTFGDTLSHDEVVAILEYIKSYWGPEERAFQWEQTVRSSAGGPQAADREALLLQDPHLVAADGASEAHHRAIP
jgi:mono/diheme cytochrome c family protein